jgi:hypothetical protein
MENSLIGLESKLNLPLLVLAVSRKLSAGLVSSCDFLKLRKFGFPIWQNHFTEDYTTWKVAPAAKPKDRMRLSHDL